MSNIYKVKIETKIEQLNKQKELIDIQIGILKEILNEEGNNFNIQTENSTSLNKNKDNIGGNLKITATVEEILSNCNSMSLTELYAKVLEKLGDNIPNATLRAALMNKKKFERIERGVYKLKKQTITKENENSVPNECITEENSLN